MLVQIGLLGERLIAAWSGTDKRALTGMYAQVVKEISPLIWGHTAALEGTPHDSDSTIRFGVLELIYAEVFCLWHGPVLWFNFVAVVLIVASHDLDLVTSDGNFLLDLFVVNFIATKEKRLPARSLKLLLSQVEGLAYLFDLLSFSTRPRLFISGKMRFWTWNCSLNR